MSSFYVLASPGNGKMEVSALHVNLWILPGILGGRVVLCDIGVKFRPVDRDSDELQFQIGVPFTVDGEVDDLASCFGIDSNPHTASLVFGNDEEIAYCRERHSYIVDDSHGKMIVCNSNVSSSELCTDSVQPFTVLSIKTRNLAQDDEYNYVRIRCRLSDCGNVWRWHKVSYYRSFAVSDIRVNDARSVPPIADRSFSHRAFDIEKANLLLVYSSKLRAGLQSPLVEYVRVLEKGHWRHYLKRKVSASDEVFYVVHWARREPITQDKPFRVSAEIERRRISFLLPIFSMILLIAVLWLGVQSKTDMQDSMLWTMGGWLLGKFFWLRTTVFATAILFLLWLLSPILLEPLLTSLAHWSPKAKKLIRRWEAKRFKP